MPNREKNEDFSEIYAENTTLFHVYLILKRLGICSPENVQYHLTDYLWRGIGNSTDEEHKPFVHLPHKVQQDNGCPCSPCKTDPRCFGKLIYYPTGE